MREPPCWPVAPKTVRSLLILCVFYCYGEYDKFSLKGIDEVCSPFLYIFHPLHGVSMLQRLRGPKRLAEPGEPLRLGQSGVGRIPLV